MLARLLDHPRLTDVRVDLRRRDVRVTQHRLDRAQVRVVLDEVGSERVAELCGETPPEGNRTSARRA